MKIRSMRDVPCWAELVWRALPEGTRGEAHDVARRLRALRPRAEVELFYGVTRPATGIDQALVASFGLGVALLLQKLPDEPAELPLWPLSEGTHAAVDRFGQAAAFLLLWHGQRGPVTAEGVVLTQAGVDLAGLALCQEGEPADEGTELYLLEGRLLGFLAAFLTTLDAALSEEQRAALTQVVHEAAADELARAAVGGVEA